MKLKAPAFSLKKSAQGVLRFSQSGELLAQVTSRVVVWNVPERKELCSVKVIPNEHFVAFHEGSHRLAIKNSNGELAFVDLPSGHLISGTGRFEDFRMGCQPCFLEGGDLLVDGGRGGTVTVWRVLDSSVADRIDLACNDVRDIAHSERADLVAFLCATVGSTVISLFRGDLASTGMTTLTASDFAIDPSQWWEAGHLAFSPCGTRLAFIAKAHGPEARYRLFILDLPATAVVASLEVGDDTRGWPTCLSWSHDGHVAFVYHENPMRKGMTMPQYEAARNSRTWESVHVLEAASGRVVEKVYVSGVNRAAFRPGGAGLALNCNQFSGAFLPDFRLLAEFGASRSPR